MDKGIKFSKKMAISFVVIWILLGMVLGLIGIFPTVIQGIFAITTVFCTLQNLAFIKFNLTGQVSDKVKVVFERVSIPSRNMNFLRLITLAGMIIERSFIGVEVSLDDFKIVLIVIALNFVTQAFLKLSSDNAALKNTESAVFIAKMSVDDKVLAAQELEIKLVGDINSQLETELSEDILKKVLAILAESDMYKYIHRLHLLRKP